MLSKTRANTYILTFLLLVPVDLNSYLIKHHFFLIKGYFELFRYYYYIIIIINGLLKQCTRSKKLN